MGVTKKEEECDTGSRHPAQEKSAGNLKDVIGVSRKKVIFWGQPCNWSEVQQIQTEVCQRPGRRIFFKKTN